MTAGVTAAALLLPGVSHGQEGPAHVPDQDEARITLNFPENVPLSTLIAYVSTRLGLNILYDEAQVNQRVTLRTPTPIAEGALLELLDAVLKARNLVLEEAGVPGLMRIVPAQQLPEVAGLAPPGEEPPERGAVTRVFPLEYARAERVNGLVAPFVTKPGGTVSVLPEERLVVVTDFAQNMGRIGRLIELIDTPRSEAVIRAIDVEHGDAQALLRVVQPLLQARARATGDPTAERSVMLTADPRTNHLMVVGLPGVVDETLALVDSLDRPRDVVRKVYRPTVIAPERLDALLRKVIEPEPTKTSYRSAADTKGGTLVVTATSEVHDQIASLLDELDQLPTSEQQPVRFYKLTNTLAKDVLATIQSLQGGGGGGGGAAARSRFEEIGGVRFGRERDRDGGRSGSGGRFDDFGRGDGRGDRGETFRTYQMEGEELFEPYEGEAGPAEAPVTPLVVGGEEPGTGIEVEPDEAQISGGSLIPGDRERRRATVAMDENTNSIIVIAPPAEQRIYERIIQQLDQRRPQVLIETTIVSLDTSDGFTFGVDIGYGEDGDDGRLLTFSAFGLSVADPDTGELELGEVGSGGTFAFLSPDIADVVVRALATSSRSRLVSMPRVLVNDNETGTLVSEDEVPFIVTVVPGGDLAVQSTDYATAGTNIEVTPHISDGDYLQLEYAIELSSFTGRPQTNLPPSAQNNTIESVVTIPDGHTIVVGGLNQQNATETLSKVPFLGDIPIVKHLFRSVENTGNNTTLFVFIRPTILRDDRFRDLKYISSVEREAAEIPHDFPRSEPLLLAPTLGDPVGAEPTLPPSVLDDFPESEPMPLEP